MLNELINIEKLLCGYLLFFLVRPRIVEIRDGLGVKLALPLLNFTILANDPFASFVSEIRGR